MSDTKPGGPRKRDASQPFGIWYRFRGAAFLPPMIFMFVFTRWEVEREVLIWPTGLLLFGLGEALRLWAQVHLRYRLAARENLTRTGPYRYVRNPIYVGNTLILLSLCVMSELVWLAPAMLIWCAVVYSLVVRHEEKRLMAKYGAPYAEFLEAVPRWLPRLPRHSASVTPRARGYLRPAVRAELHNLLLLVPFVLKELWMG